VLLGTRCVLFWQVMAISRVVSLVSLRGLCFLFAPRFGPLPPRFVDDSSDKIPFVFESSDFCAPLCVMTSSGRFSCSRHVFTPRQVPRSCSFFRAMCLAFFPLCFSGQFRFFFFFFDHDTVVSTQNPVSAFVHPPGNFSSTLNGKRGLLFLSFQDGRFLHRGPDRRGPRALRLPRPLRSVRTPLASSFSPSSPTNCLLRHFCSVGGRFSGRFLAFI